MDIQAAQQLLDKFKHLLAQPHTNTEEANNLLNKLKIGLTSIKGPQQAVLLLSRDVFENAVELSIKCKDIPSFERYIAQLKPYYYDFDSLIPPSQNKYQILGLNLLCLLAQNRIAEFHSELELIPLDQHHSKFIQHPLSLESWMMEGAFKKIWNDRAECAPQYVFFMDILINTIRNEIADCFQKAYEFLPKDDARRLLLFSSVDQLEDFAAEREWTESKGGYTFQNKANTQTKLEIPSMKLIHETLSYAKELERII
eukprot:TRINITY_DN4102_c0_g2_i2.p1 TRINITY_DN4102_c0_g2~~TRINITY_DN4102_c0_g2_i2.p1  ORF type:complete len:256 (+),score=59.98 TRINITY_DN4102_c0_g2_i2:204-971(+)